MTFFIQPNQIVINQILSHFIFSYFKPHCTSNAIEINIHVFLVSVHLSIKKKRTARVLGIHKLSYNNHLNYVRIC